MEDKKEQKEQKLSSEKNNDFVTSYFAWIELDEQKKIVERLENLTYKEDEK